MENGDGSVIRFLCRPLPRCHIAAFFILFPVGFVDVTFLFVGTGRPTPVCQGAEGFEQGNSIEPAGLLAPFRLPVTKRVKTVVDARRREIEERPRIP